MEDRGLLKFRMIVSIVLGAGALLASFNPDFLRPSIESRTIAVHVFLALFGAACLVQSYVLGKQLRSEVPS